jgi:hypothetical protein
MAKKLENPVNFADVCYVVRLNKVFKSWVARDQYLDRAALLDLPRSYSQLESYWMMWVPSDFADTSHNMANCIMSLYDEASFLKSTERARVADLEGQLALIKKERVMRHELVDSLKGTCALDTDGKMGWSWIGSLASAHALNSRGSAKGFDRRYGRGTTSRTLIDHLTVRHSARIDKQGRLKKGTVAELMLNSGADKYLSTVEQTFRFLYMKRPTFFNHPKGGEHKPREISITDPDSRICLSDAELICGLYGKSTRVDFLKDPAKNSKFYRTSSRLMSRGGGIQSSDATRYGPSMSNFAIAIMLLLLGTWSMHLKWAACIYARLAYRQMLLPTFVKPYLTKIAPHKDTGQKALDTLAWMSKMPTACYENGEPHVWYCTSHHMGQGMSHHSSSLLHAGGLIMSVDAASKCFVMVNGKQVDFDVSIMVTSDDSTIMVETKGAGTGSVISRAERQIAARIFLQLVRAARTVCLRAVSVCPNLVKEMISAVKGEFNSQDTGIGGTCPILGFRELISLIVVPSAPSLVGDYLNAFACARDIAFAGQGLSTGSFVHHLLIDGIEERWGLSAQEKSKLSSLDVIPEQIVTGVSGTDLVGSPAAMLNAKVRASMLRESIDANTESEDLDPNTRDSVFAPLMHVKVAMSRQHRTAIATIKGKIRELTSQGMEHQAKMLKDSLRSTISSARSRNLGRVAFRVRSRPVVPRDYRGIKFEKNSMIESTLNWISLMNSKMRANTPSPEDIRNGNSVAGFVKMLSTQKTAFPRPPKLRRFHASAGKKPKFIEGTYGQTPFGQHAIARSGASLVQSIGKEEREAIQLHLAHARHRKVSEHVEYGGAMVISWSDMVAGIVVALDITHDLEAQMREHIRMGDFGPLGMSILKTLVQENPGYPVLALHTYDGVRGLWHAIHNGATYSVSTKIDITHHDGAAMHYQQPDGTEVLLAMQGFSREYVWADTVPSSQEVSDYQRSDYDGPMPSMVRSIEDQNIVGGGVDGVTYSTKIRYLGKETLVYIAPELTSTPRDNPALRSRVPYLRAKVVASMSAAGYWHTSMRGVAFRAYLRGAFEGETVWTGGVIGWRQSSTSVPTYFNPAERAHGVRGLLVLGGFDNVDQLSKYNPDMHSSGYKVVCQSNTESYDTAIRVDSSYIEAIVNANRGQRYHVRYTHGDFLNFQVGPPPNPSTLMMPDQARNMIVDMLSGSASNYGW